MHRIYNYYIHPQWDFIGSNTLYAKLLYADYDEGYAFIELIGEWNDCLTNDIMYLKRHLADHLIAKGISKFALFCDNVLNFHSSDDSYYEEWWDDIKDEDGWLVILNTREHIYPEMEHAFIQNYAHFGQHFNDINWRKKSPGIVFEMLKSLLLHEVKQLQY